MRIRVVVLAVLFGFASACGDDASGRDTPDTSDGGQDGDGGADSDADADADADGDAGADADVEADGGAEGGAAFRGDVLFVERFEDTDFEARGWYDSPRANLSTMEHIAGSSSSFECRFREGATGCEGGTPGRHLFDAQEAVYLSYWVKYSDNYVGSGHPYHPHEFHFLTDADDRWVGPSHTHLTTYTEQVGGVPHLALQDSVNVDLNCVLLNDDSFVGCGGDFGSYAFTEARSVCSCNGLAGDLDQRDCFPNGEGTFYSSRAWVAGERMFTDDPGPRYKADWHFIECYFHMNSIAGGVGSPDGAIRYWYDGEEIIASDRILMRTGEHPTLRFNQFLIAPYIGDGSPVDQTMWVDDLTVAAGR